MAIALLLARSVLAVVLVVAAITKLRDRRGTAEAAVHLGVPERAAPSTAALLPLAEAGCAVLLLLPSTARVGGAAAAALFGVFTVLIVRTLRSGARPACHCFGQLSDEPIGAGTVVRNVALVVVAGIVAIAGASSSSVAEAVEEASASAALDAGAVVLLGLLTAVVVLVGEQRGLSRRMGDLEAGVSPTVGIAVGRAAPSFALPDLDGQIRSLAQLHDDRPALLVFTDAGCAPCAELLPDLADWSYAYQDAFRIVIVASGGRDANLAKRDEHGLDRVLLQQGDEVARAYRYNGTPAAIVVGTDGLVAEAMASGSDGVRGLVAGLIARAGGVRLPVGIGAPPFHAHAATGEHVDNATVRGAMVVVLFWDQACSYCNALDPELGDRIGRFEAAGVALLVASASGGTRWPATAGVTVVADSDRRMANAFGSPGTPSAILVDAEGKVASTMAVGGDEVLALVDRAISMGNLAGSFAVRPA